MKDKILSHLTMESLQAVFYRKHLKKVFSFSQNTPLSNGKGEMIRSVTPPSSLGAELTVDVL